jgi:hypothetical protein
MAQTVRSQFPTASSQYSSTRGKCTEPLQDDSVRSHQKLLGEREIRDRCALGVPIRKLTSASVRGRSPEASLYRYPTYGSSEYET